MVALIRGRAVEQAVTGASFYFNLEPTIAALPTGYVATWYANGGSLDGSGASIRAQVFGSDGSKVGSEIAVNTTVLNDQNLSSVTALAGGGFAISWIDQPRSVRAQVFDPAGQKLGAELSLGAIDYYDNGLRPAITTLSNGDFAVAWGLQGDVSGRIVSATGVLKALFSATSGGFGNEPEIVATTDGGFSLFWNDQSARNGDADVGIISQHFTAGGAPSGGATLINSTLPGSQYSPAATLLSDGSTAVVWTWNGLNGTETGGIQAQIIRSDGTRLSNDLLVSSLSPSAQANPEIAALSWGGFVVSWADYSRVDTDFSTPSVRAQIFDVDGTRIGDEIQLNSATNEAEQWPYIAVLSDNSLVAAWTASNTGALVQRLYSLPSVGTLGNDYRQLAADGEIYAARAGDDTVTGGVGADIVDGGLGKDILIGNGGGDSLSGGAGDDIIDGGAGLDTMEGGAGNDMFYVDSRGDSVFESIGGGQDRILSSASYALGAGRSVELITTRDASGIASIDFVGNELANTLVGNAGVNILNGGLGADVLVGLAGNDVLIGGDDTANTMQGGIGNDTYYVSAQGDSVVEFGGEGIDLVRTSLNVLTLAREVENLVFTGRGEFVAVGNSADNVIVAGTENDIVNGESGNDILFGGEGNDVLIGGTGANTLHGGAGDDLYYVSSLSDLIVEAVGNGYDTISTSLTAYTLMGAVEALLYNGLDAFRGTGRAISDVIAGSSGNDELYGLDGDDTLSGNGGADYIFGGGGNDQINGGMGDDRLSGGAGADLFVFADAGVDTVIDFAAGSDRIFLDRAVFTGLGAGALAGDLFARGDTAIDADDRILYNPDTGMLLYDADGSGATDAILFGIISVPSGVLGASDFFVI